MNKYFQKILNLFRKRKSCLVLFAEKELALAGYDGKDKYDNRVKEAILELLETFANQRHSGFSASYVSNVFNKLSRYEPLTPLTGQADEWGDVTSREDGEILYQNKRDSTVFKVVKGTVEEAFKVDAVIWIDRKFQNNAHTNADSRLYIKRFPFVPKSFEVEVDENNNILDNDEYCKAVDYYSKENV